jgi:hypothetical protein
MSIRMLTDLDVALGNAGIPFTGIPYSVYDPTGAENWTTRTRPPSTGDFQPEGVLCHHTASPAGTSDRVDLQCILAGNSDAPGPISQLYIGRSGTVYIVAAGRANHGGGGRRPGVDTGPGCASMNALLLGIEAGNNGVGERWPDVQTTVYAKVVAALCAHYGWSITNDVYLHATTGPPNGGCNSKIDPAGPWQLQPALVGSTTWDLGVWRNFCIDQQGSPVPPIPPSPQPIPEEDIVPKCIIHVDESQPAGSPGYYRFNAVWNWAGAWRYNLPSELGVKSAVYENTGDADVFNHPLGDIIRNPSWVQPVGSLDGYGAAAGHDPGDV